MFIGCLIFVNSNVVKLLGALDVLIRELCLKNVIVLFKMIYFFMSCLFCCIYCMFDICKF